MSTSFTARWNEAAIDENYEKWRHDTSSVSADWVSFFEGFELGYSRYTKNSKNPAVASASAESGASSSLESRVEALIYNYRTLGHTLARLNPLSATVPQQPLLELSEFNLSDADLDQSVSSRSYRDGEHLKVREIIDDLKSHLLRHPRHRIHAHPGPAKSDIGSGSASRLARARLITQPRTIGFSGPFTRPKVSRIFFTRPMSAVSASPLREGSR